jgi:hypothetical protein
MPEYSPEKKSAAPTTPSVQEEKIMEKSAVV